MKHECLEPKHSYWRMQLYERRVILTESQAILKLEGPDLMQDLGEYDLDFNASDELTSIDDVIRETVALYEAEISRIDGAIQRIDTNRYGYCEACGIEISGARLAFVPETLFCAACDNE